MVVQALGAHSKLGIKGYHDIMTVLFLTLPEEQQLSCAEQLSLHRLRDSMGKGLEPLIGLLRCVVAHTTHWKQDLISTANMLNNIKT